VLQGGGEYPVAVPWCTGLRVEQILGHQEQAQPFAARGRADGPCEHKVGDVLEQVIRVSRGDEPLDALDVPGAVVLIDRARTGGSDIRAGVRFGQHHRRTPIALYPNLGPAPLLGGADTVQHAEHRRARQVEERRGLAAEEKLVDRRVHRRRDVHTAEFLVEAQQRPSRPLPGPHRGLEGFG